MDMVFGFFGILFIYGMGVVSGLLSSALIIKGKEREKFENEISEHRERQSSER